jgi:hypothetical protein
MQEAFDRRELLQRETVAGSVRERRLGLSEKSCRTDIVPAEKRSC